MSKATLEQAQLVFEDGLRCLQRGNADDADEFFAKAHRLDPNNVDTLNLLGVREYQKQHYQEAIRLLSAAHQLHSHSAQILNNLGLAHNSIGEFQRALEFFDLAITIDAGVAEIHNNRGNSLKGLHQNAGALNAYQIALQLQPDHAEAISNQGIIYLEQKNYRQAVEYFEKAIQLKPTFASAFNSLGNAFTALNEYSSAFQAYDRALQINPQYLDACLNFGIALKKAKVYVDAVKCLQYGVQLNPRHAKTYFLMGEVFFDIGDTESADINFRKSLELDPGNMDSQFALTIAQIPKVFSNTEEVHQSRENFSHEMKRLQYLETSASTPKEILGNIGRHPFYLAYQNEENQFLLNEYGDICSEAAKSIQAILNDAKVDSKENHIKIRLGIVSHYFCDHPVWHAITKGWITQFNLDLFEIHIFNTGGREDRETDLAKRRGESYTNNGESTMEMADLILHKQLDILLFPEIGMDVATKALACLRLAPVQIVSWGHPETTGLPTVDYFLSADSFEPKDADRNYREKLITLPQLGTYVESEVVETIELNLSDFGISSTSPILLCPGSPSKYSPQQDASFIEIAKAVGDCQFIFFDFQKELTFALHSRLSKAFLDAGLNPDTYIQFIPFLKKEEFYSLMLQADLYLDTIGFSGFNTALQAIACNLPIVTMDGPYMRGRLASAILRHLKLGDFITATNQEYIDTAVGLIQNKALRQSHQERIAKSQLTLFNNADAIRFLEAFLIKAGSSSI